LHDVLVSYTRDPSLHQPRRRCAEDYFPVRGYMVGMGVADKNLLRPKVRIIGIHPKAKLGQMQPAFTKLNAQ
jgi:hypothetical protein